MKYAYIPVDKLRPHEEVIPERLEKIKNELMESKAVYPVLVVEVNAFYVILDGHHRARALRELGYKRIPAAVLSFDEYLNWVELYSWHILVPRTEAEKLEYCFEERNGSFWRVKAEYREEVAMKIISNSGLYWFVPGDKLELYRNLPKELVLVYRRPFSKEEVIDRALKGELFAPKSTRHKYSFVLSPMPLDP